MVMFESVYNHSKITFESIFKRFCPSLTCFKQTKRCFTDVEKYKGFVFMGNKSFEVATNYTVPIRAILAIIIFIT